MYKLRIATLDDAEITYKWVNDSIIRQFSFSKGKIEWRKHYEWFQQKIYSDQCVYLILEDDSNKKIGSIRFDLDKDYCWVINYLLDSSFHGQGIGEFLLRKGIDKLVEMIPNIQTFCGIVLKSNGASIRIFEKLGFICVLSDYSTMKFIKKV
jgi:UDP-2,4-diacetamido-2,4,6-trideoxy-beta-L-altropyranose hydrolase